ncbi:hypothetical protein [Nitrosomonas communis]|uniref:hypothetical protein n=1 Tax=Nitrosomonas communis TaxID=44574 RepID=UPI003D28DFA7
MESSANERTALPCVDLFLSLLHMCMAIRRNLERVCIAGKKVVGSWERKRDEQESVVSALHELFWSEVRHQPGLRLDGIGQHLIRSVPGESFVDSVKREVLVWHGGSFFSCFG